MRFIHVPQSEHIRGTSIKRRELGWPCWSYENKNGSMKYSYMLFAFIFIIHCNDSLLSFISSSLGNFIWHRKKINVVAKSRKNFFVFVFIEFHNCYLVNTKIIKKLNKKPRPVKHQFLMDLIDFINLTDRPVHIILISVHPRTSTMKKKTSAINMSPMAEIPTLCKHFVLTWLFVIF